MDMPLNAPLDDSYLFTDSSANHSQNTHTPDILFPSSGPSSHHSSPASGSDESANHPRTPSPPDLNPHVDLSPDYSLSSFDPASYTLDTAAFPPAPSSLTPSWENFGITDWSKIFHNHQLTANQAAMHPDRVPKQEPFQPPLDLDSFPSNFSFPDSLAAFTFQSSAQPFPGAIPPSAPHDLRFPLSGYPEPPRHMSASSGTPPTPASAMPNPHHLQQLQPSSGQQHLLGLSKQSSTSPPSSVAQHPTVSFNLPPASGSANPGNAPKQPAKRRLTPHNTIERRYRRNLNSCIQALRDAVPAVAILDRERWGDRWIPDERGYVDGVRRAGKNSKSVVLEKGVEYIGVLNRRASRLARERAALQALLCSFPQGQMLFAQWEHTFLPMDRHLYGSDELFRVPPGVPLAEAGVGLDDNGADDEEEDGEDWDDDEGDEDEAPGRKGKRQRLSIGGADELAPGMAIPAPPPMLSSANGADAERRKRGRPRKNTNTQQPSPPGPQSHGLSPPMNIQPIAQQQQQHNIGSPPGRLSPEQQMALQQQQRIQAQQMQQLAMQRQQQQQQQQHLQQMVAMQQQQLHHAQSQLQQHQHQQGMGMPQRDDNGAAQQAPRYLLAAFLCFSVFRTGGPFSSSASASEGTHEGTVISPLPGGSYLSRAVPAAANASWMDMTQVVLLALLVLSLLLGGGWSWGGKSKSGSQDEKVDARRRAERVLLKRKDSAAYLRALASYLPVLLIPSSPADRAILALLLPSWLQFLSSWLWKTAAFDIADTDDDPVVGGKEGVLHGALTLSLQRAREVIRTVRDSPSSKTRQARDDPLFDVLAREAIQQHIAARAQAKFISSVAASSPTALGQYDLSDLDDDDVEEWAERAALDLGGEAKALLELWEDVTTGWEGELEAEAAEDPIERGKQDDAHTMLFALSLLPVCVPDLAPAESRGSAGEGKPTEALRLRLRRALGAKVFDTSSRLSDARDRVVDLLDPRRSRR